MSYVITIGILLSIFLLFNLFIEMIQGVFDLNDFLMGYNKKLTWRAILCLIFTVIFLIIIFYLIHQEVLKTFILKG